MEYLYTFLAHSSSDQTLFDIVQNCIHMTLYSYGLDYHGIQGYIHQMEILPKMPAEVSIKIW